MPQDKTGASLASGAELSNPIFGYVPDLRLNERMLAPCEKITKLQINSIRKSKFDHCWSGVVTLRKGENGSS